MYDDLEYMASMALGDFRDRHDSQRAIWALKHDCCKRDLLVLERN